MDEKYLWPLVGVILGWLLTFLAANLKDRQARRGRIGRLLTKFIIVQGQLSTLMSTTEAYKDQAADLPAYERYRKGISDRHFLEVPDVVDGLRKAIDEVSSDYPLHAIKFQALLDSLVKIKNASMQESAKSAEIYIRVVSMHEVGLDTCAVQLAEQISRLAWMHGVITYILVKVENHQVKRRGAFKQDFFAETMSQIRSHSKTTT